MSPASVSSIPVRLIVVGHARGSGAGMWPCNASVLRHGLVLRRAMLVLGLATGGRWQRLVAVHVLLLLVTVMRGVDLLDVVEGNGIWVDYNYNGPVGRRIYKDGELVKSETYKDGEYVED